MAEKPKKHLGGRVSEEAWQLESQHSDTLTVDSLIEAQPFHVDPGEKDLPVISTRVPQWMMREIIILVDRRGTSYQTKGDVAKDALYIGLKILNIRYGSKDWKIEHGMAEVIDGLGKYKRMDENIGKLAEALEHLNKVGEGERAKRGLQDFIDRVSESDDISFKRTILKKLTSIHTTRELLKDMGLLDSVSDYTQILPPGTNNGKNGEEEDSEGEGNGSRS